MTTSQLIKVNTKHKENTQIELLVNTKAYEQKNLMRTTSLGTQSAKAIKDANVKKQNNKIQHSFLHVKDKLKKKAETSKSKRKPFNIEEEIYEPENKYNNKLEIEQPYKKPKDLHKIRLESQEDKIGKFSIKRPKTSILKDQKKISTENNKDFNKIKKTTVHKQIIETGELSFRKKGQINTKTQMFFEQKSKNQTFSNINQKSITSTPSKNQKILDSMRQTIPEKKERDNIPISTNQVSENDSQKKEETEEEFDFEDFGF